MKFYLCKYIPPRADFLATMTAEESKWMKQHGDFLNNLLDKGLIVAHGPVMDPSGGYGVSLCQIADDQDIATITSEDPIVKNGGFAALPKKLSTGDPASRQMYPIDRSCRDIANWISALLSPRSEE